MKVTLRNAFAPLPDEMPDARVVIDVFRASTTVISILESGVSELLIANELDVLKEYSAKGYLVISEVFDLGIDNSPTLVRKTPFKTGKAILKTSNLTTAISANAFNGAILVAAFNNLATVAAHLRLRRYGWVEILPAGLMARQMENTEDSHCAKILLAILKGVGSAFPERTILEKRIQEKLRQEERPQHYIDDLHLAIQMDRSKIVPMVTPLSVECFRVAAV